MTMRPSMRPAFIRSTLPRTAPPIARQSSMSEGKCRCTPSGSAALKLSPSSQPEDFAPVLEVFQEWPARTLVHHAPALQRVGTVGQGQHEVEIVIDDDDGDLSAKPIEYREQLLGDRG